MGRKQERLLTAFVRPWQISEIAWEFTNPVRPLRTRQQFLAPILKMILPAVRSCNSWFMSKPYLLLSLTSLFWAGNVVLGRFIGGPDSALPAVADPLEFGLRNCASFRVGASEKRLAEHSPPYRPDGRAVFHRHRDLQLARLLGLAIHAGAQRAAAAILVARCSSRCSRCCCSASG